MWTKSAGLAAAADPRLLRQQRLLYPQLHGLKGVSAPAPLSHGFPAPSTAPRHRRSSSRPTPPVRLVTSASALPPAVTAGFIAASAAFGAMSLYSQAKGDLPDALPVEVVSGGGPVVSHVLDCIRLFVDQPYRPALPWPNQHVETIVAAVTRSLPNVVFRRECLRTADGGAVALDWPLDVGDLQGVKPAEQGAPVLILLPGLTGGSEDTYVRHLLVRARKRGWHAAVFNSRGCANSPVTTPQFYSASFTEDMRRVVHHVGTLHRGSRLYAVGWSLGANILVRYLGQEGERAPLAGAVSLCNPFDLVLADRNFHIGFNNFYDRRLAQSLNAIFLRHAPLFEGLGGEYNIELVKGAKSVREFDDGLTRVSFGYPSVDHYYADASSSKNVKDVHIPLLCIQAKDDPIAPNEGIPREAMKANPNCLLLVTPYGGHLGWMAGDGAPFGWPWTDPIVMRFLDEVEEWEARKGGRIASDEFSDEDPEDTTFEDKTNGGVRSGRDGIRISW